MHVLELPMCYVASADHCRIHRIKYNVQYIMYEVTTLKCSTILEITELSALTRSITVHNVECVHNRQSY